MISPFLSDVGITLRDTPYLDVALIEKINTSFSNKEIREVITQYLTEGIPHAFKANPLIYEDIRNWLGQRLKINTKNITLTGSSRLGFSISPYKWGKPYTQHSDLDFLIVSADLFEDFKSDFKQFASDIKQKLEKKEPISELDFQNFDSLKNSILNNEFIDQAKMPFDKRYEHIHQAYDLLAHLLLRMSATKNCPQSKKASIRVYKNWEACLEMLVRNFKNGYKHRISN